MVTQAPSKRDWLSLGLALGAALAAIVQSFLTAQAVNDSRRQALLLRRMETCASAQSAADSIVGGAGVVLADDAFRAALTEIYKAPIGQKSLIKPGSLEEIVAARNQLGEAVSLLELMGPEELASAAKEMQGEVTILATDRVTRMIKSNADISPPRMIGDARSAQARFREACRQAIGPFRT